MKNKEVSWIALIGYDPTQTMSPDVSFQAPAAANLSITMLID
jgi:hypothetical protein